MTSHNSVAPLSRCYLTLRCDSQIGCFVGVDIDDAQLQKASENIEFAELGHRIHLLKAISMGEKPWRRCENLDLISMFRLQRAAEDGPISVLTPGIKGERCASCYIFVYIMTC